MKVIGLTGGIASGKSTIANMFEAHGIAVFDADKAVHLLLEKDALTIEKIAQQFEEVVTQGVVNRRALGKIVFGDEAALKQLENILHPMVRQQELDFIAQQKAQGAKAALLDIPLLFETGAEALCDMVVVTDCSPQTQMARLMMRPHMSEQKAQGILARQMAREQRNEKADIIISTEESRESCRAHVDEIVSQL